MSKIKGSVSFFLLINVSLLYAIYFAIKNFNDILTFILSILQGIAASLTPLFIALIIAYLIAPLSEFIDVKLAAKIIKVPPDDPLKKDKMLRMRYFISILLAIAAVIIFIASLIYAFAALISGTLNVGSLYESLESIVYYWSSIKSSVYNCISALPAGRMRDTAFRMYEILVSYAMRSIAPEKMIHLISNISSIAINICIGTVLAVYLLKDKEYFIRMWRKLLHLILPQKANAILTELLHNISEVLSLFLRGAVADALIVSLLSSAALSIYGLPFSVFSGCFAGITNIIPYFGPFIGAVPALITGIFSGGFTYGLGAAAILFIVQQLDCNIIYPKIVGSSTGLHPLFVLLSVSILGHYCGIFGMIIAVPTAAIIKAIFSEFVHL